MQRRIGSGRAAPLAEKVSSRRPALEREQVTSDFSQGEVAELIPALAAGPIRVDLVPERAGFSWSERYAGSARADGQFRRLTVTS